MIKCIKVKVFQVTIDKIKDEKEIISEVFVNCTCHVVRNLPTPSAEAIDGAIEKLIGDFMGVVGSTAKKFPLVRFPLAQPILRPRNEGYTEI
jgi:hypothetical protein